MKFHIYRTSRNIWGQTEPPDDNTYPEETPWGTAYFTDLPDLDALTALATKHRRILIWFDDDGERFLEIVDDTNR